MGWRWPPSYRHHYNVLNWAIPSIRSTLSARPGWQASSHWRSQNFTGWRNGPLYRRRRQTTLVLSWPFNHWFASQIHWKSTCAGLNDLSIPFLMFYLEFFHQHCNGAAEKALAFAEKADAQAPDKINKDWMDGIIKTLQNGKDFNEGWAFKKNPQRELRVS